jgi:hypothetical protein
LEASVAVATWVLGLPSYQAPIMQTSVTPYFNSLPFCGPGLGYEATPPPHTSPVVLPSLRRKLQSLSPTEPGPLGMEWVISVAPPSARVFRRGHVHLDLRVRGVGAKQGESIPIKDLILQGLDAELLVAAQVHGCPWVVRPLDTDSLGTSNGVLALPICLYARSAPAYLAIQVIDRTGAYTASNVMTTPLRLVPQLVLPALPGLPLASTLPAGFPTLPLPPTAGQPPMWLVTVGATELVVSQAVPLPAKGQGALRQVDPSCPRLASFDIRADVGLGHRFTNYVEGLRFAAAVGATYLHRPGWSGESYQHGAYDWFERLLPLSHGELFLNETLSRYNPEATMVANWTSYASEGRAFSGSQACHVWLLGSESRCPGLPCPPLEGMLHDARGLVRAKLASDEHDEHDRTPLLFDPADVNVAWHLRVGDINLQAGRRDYFLRIRRMLEGALTPDVGRVRHFFFAEARHASYFGTPPLGFAFLAELFPDARFVTDLPVRETLLHLFNADVVVGLGSTFPLLAATASWRPVALLAPTQVSRAE